MPSPSQASAVPAEGPPSRQSALAGMACVDTSGNPRIPILMEMVAALSRARTPNELLRDFGAGMQRLEGRQGYVSLSTRGLRPGEYRITRLLVDDAPWHLHEGDPWRNRASLPVRSGGFLGEVIRQAYPEIIHHLALRDDPVVGDALAKYGSLMAIPLFDNGEPLNWAVMLREDPEGFTVQELEEVILRGNLVGSTVRNVLAAQELREAHDKIRREFEQIASIQRALLPKKMPDITGVSLSASYATYDQAGGDYYDFLALGSGDGCEQRCSGPWGLVIADAAGHGPAAAVMMAMLHAILHAYPDVPENPGVVLKHANEHLCRKGIESSFVTAFFAIYHPTTRRLMYARAGHPPPLIKNAGAGGDVRRLDDVGSIPLGIFPDVDFENSVIVLEPGQTLVMYTDGVTEAKSADHDMFDVAGIETALHLCSGEPECVQNSVMTALRKHEGDVRPSDDQTLVAMRVEA